MGRLVSGFNKGRHLSGKSEREVNLIAVAVQGQSREEQFAMYVTFGDLLGCQTKMVVGRMCANSYTLTQADLRRAKQRIEKMSFIGITDEWDRSICLFHKQFGGQIVYVEYTNERKGR